MKVQIEIDTRTFVRFWLVVIGFVLAGWMIYSARQALIIIGTAVFLALALNMPVKKIASWLPSKSRLAGTFLSFAVLVLIIGGVVWFVVPPKRDFMHCRRVCRLLVRLRGGFVRMFPFPAASSGGCGDG